MNWWNWRARKLPADATGARLPPSRTTARLVLTIATPIPLPEQTIHYSRMGAGHKAQRWDEKKGSVCPGHRGAPDVEFLIIAC